MLILLMILLMPVPNPCRYPMFDANADVTDADVANVADAGTALLLLLRLLDATGSASIGSGADADADVRCRLVRKVVNQINQVRQSSRISSTDQLSTITYHNHSHNLGTHPT
ncbi:hypothetical protein GGS26DRAFT_575441 [Hypomontagnella submonticulosa]|nr:hypothetical protein GGS26DRAFT_575441 [Hypomontagnella submonticulosa]